MPSVVVAEARPAWWPYVQIARTDHWFKNAFMLLGVLLALFYQATPLDWTLAARLLVALASTCLVASSNYVLNELLDGPTDAMHPQKRFRPVPAGLVRPFYAQIEWLALGAAGVALGLTINRWFAASAAWLWIMGVLYNIPPVRTKEWPYVDVLTESINNPIRLFLGWFALVDNEIPPLSLTIAYWMAGAFFMATKRFAEYRHIGDPVVAASYRRSFGHYSEERLLTSMLFYATACALFGGIFIVRYHLELILFTPLGAGLFAYYLRLGLKPDSPTQNPERLYRERGFSCYLVLCAVMFVLLMFTSVPWMYALFNVEPSRMVPLWRLGSGAGF